MDTEILKSYPLCHRCFGRLYAKLLHTSNYDRGRSIKMAKAIELESKLHHLKEGSENEEEIKNIKERGTVLPLQKWIDRDKGDRRHRGSGRG